MNIGQPHVISVTEAERGIQFIAAILTGDASNWTTLVQTNQLLPPYVTTDPSSIYGPPIASTTLTSSVNADVHALVLPNMPQSTNTIYLSYAGSGNLVAEAVGIRSYDGTTFTLSAPFKNAYPVGTSVQFFATYQTGNTNVLLPGDVLYLPLNGDNANFTYAGQGQLSDDFGTDIAFPMSIVNGDIAKVSGVNTANQRFASVLQTDLSSVPLHLDFGSQLRANIGTNPTQTKWSALVRNALVSLPEVSDVRNITVAQSGTALAINAKVYSNTSSTAIELSNLPVTTT